MIILKSFSIFNRTARSRKNTRCWPGRPHLASFVQKRQPGSIPQFYPRDYILRRHAVRCSSVPRDRISCFKLRVSLFLPHPYFSLSLIMESRYYPGGPPSSYPPLPSSPAPDSPKFEYGQSFSPTSALPPTVFSLKDPTAAPRVKSDSDSDDSSYDPMRDPPVDEGQRQWTSREPPLPPLPKTNGVIPLRNFVASRAPTIRSVMDADSEINGEPMLTHLPNVPKGM